MLGITHPANLCMICTLLKSTELVLSFCCRLYGSISIQVEKATRREVLNYSYSRSSKLVPTESPYATSY